MAVHQARYAGVAAACFADDAATQMPEYAAPFLSAAAANNCAAAVPSGAHSDLTYNNNGDGGGALPAPRKRRGAEVVVVEQHVSSSSALLPIPGMAKPVDARSTVMASTSGRPSASMAVPSFYDVLVSELCQHGAEMDGIVRMECERMRAGLEQVRKRQCQSLVRATSSAVGRLLQEKEAELLAARQRAADLEDRLRQVAAESQAWCGVARSNQAVAAGLRSTLDGLLRATPAPVEGFGESDFIPAAAADRSAADDAQSSCFVVGPTDASTSTPAGQWACKSCGEREASVLLLPCRHLCLCKVCEPRFEACPVCLAAKNASIHIAVD